MADPKKPPEDQAVKPEEMTYPTPPLDPNTGAPLDTRFQSAPSQEVTASPSPKSGGEEKEEDDEQETRSKSSEKPRRRR